MPLFSRISGMGVLLLLRWTAGQRESHAPGFTPKRMTGDGEQMTGYGSVRCFPSPVVRLPSSGSRGGLLLEFSRLDRRAGGDGAACHVGMQSFDHAAFQLDDALAPILREIERRDDFLGLRDFILGRRADGVAGRDLVRVNQRLAVEAHVARLG